MNAVTAPSGSPMPVPGGVGDRPGLPGQGTGEVTGADGTVVGDGTSAASRARSRWQRLRWPLAVVLVVVLVGLLASVLPPPTSQDPLAPDNPAPDGARALAEILGDRGVTVEYVRSSAEALAAAGEGSTLLVVGTYLLGDGALDAVAGTQADLVLAGAEGWHLPALTGGAMTGAALATGTREEADCPDADATAAGTVRSRGQGITALSPDVVVCFPAPGDPSSGAYAVLEQDGRRVVAFDDPTLMSNDRLAEDGTAALLLRTLGRHEELVWYSPTFGDLGEESGPGRAATGQLLPSWAGPLGAQLAVVALALALWRGRALGPVVTEPLPVTVRAAETTLGRGRLYRRSRSRGHAAAALRAGAARRAAARLGLPRSADAPEVIDALAAATGRSTDEVAGLLYGPPPTDDDALVHLARALDDLESEVHRP